MKHIRLLTLALLLASPLAHAQQNVYVGAGLGLNTSDVFDDIVCLPGAVCDFDDSSTGFKIFGGTRISENLAAEFFYADFGEFEATGTDGVTTERLTADGSAFGASLLGIAPISANAEVFGKLGLAMWSADAAASSSGGGFASVSDDGTDILYGFGAQWRANQFSFRIEYEIFNLDDTDVDSIGLSAIFHL